MSIIDAVGKSGGNVFNRTLGRLFGAGLSRGAESPLNTSGEARWSSRDSATDWRVKLTLPSDNKGSELRSLFFSNDLMAPLGDTGGIVFPLTPSIILQHQASYNPLAVTHSNYPFYAYQNSEVSSFTVVGEFPVQNSDDARHWIATLHFLRSVTKMFFGSGANQGNPPPILKFNAYGDNVFKNVPVVVTNFSVELTAGVDYISTTQGSVDRRNAIQQVSGAERVALGLSDPQSTVPTSWAPAMSIFTMQLQPVYSRNTIKNFNMQDFVSGNLNNYGASGNSEGIGFI
jgi:hypothetical protein